MTITDPMTTNDTVFATYDNQDRMLSYRNNQYFYNKNGSLTTKISNLDTTRYTYDNLGNLVEVNLPNGSLIEYIIDGQNRRIAKLLNGSIVQKWLYSGGLLPVAELDSADSIIKHFAPGYIIKADTIYRVITDHLGSVRLIVNAATGEVKQRIDYDEYGNITNVLSQNDFLDFTYAGGLYDEDTKLIRFGARDYDAETGRWTCKDPIGFGGGVSNFYEYVINDPINLVDLNGLQIYFFAKPNIFFRTLGRLAPSQRWNQTKIPKTTPQRYLEPKPQYMPPMELPKTWWGRLLDKIGDLLDEMGLGESLLKENTNPCDEEKKIYMDENGNEYYFDDEGNIMYKA